MAGVTITVVIPTLGRPTLQRAIDSAKSADHVLVCPDNTGDYGNAPRNRVLRSGEITTTHIAFLDDDDVYLPGAIETMRSQALLTMPSLFRVAHPQLGRVWKDPALRFGNVDTDGILIPNTPDMFGTWQPWEGGVGSDYAFLRSSGWAETGSFAWCERCIAVIRPDEWPGLVST